MNLFDILFMAKTGTIKPDASLFDIMFAKKLQSAMEKFVTIVGNPLNFTTRKAQLAKSTKISMEPIQEGSGDPSPENIRPIDGRTGVTLDGCGKNLYEFPFKNKLSLSGSGNNRTVVSTIYNQASIVKLKPNTNYSLSGDRTEASDVYARLATFSSYPKVGDVSIRFLSYKNDTGLTFTTSNDELWALVFETSGYDDDCHMQLELGSATAYEPYTESNDITISFGETVYGGTLDVETGVLSVDKKAVQIKDIGLVYQTSAGGVFRTNHLDDIEAETKNLISSILTVTNVSVSSMSNWTMRTGNTIYGDIVYIKAIDYIDVSTLIGAVGNEYIVYPLATPRTISLTPEAVQLLKGHNTLWTDGDSIELTYKA